MYCAEVLWCSACLFEGITSYEANAFSSRTLFHLWLGRMTCFFGGPRHLYIFVCNLRPSKRTLITSIWLALLARIVIYIVSSVIHVRQGVLLLHPSAPFVSCYFALPT